MLDESCAVHTSNDVDVLPLSVSRRRMPGPTQSQSLAEVTLERLRLARSSDSATRRVLVGQVVQDHLWLAELVTRRFRLRGEEHDDLVQVARIGLLEACERFDPDRGSFTGFAAVTISGLLKRHFRDHAWSLRPPRRDQELALRLWRRWPDIAQALGHEPTEAQLATNLSTTPAEIRQARLARQAYSHTSTDTWFDDPRADDRDLDRSEAHLVLASVWPKLTEAERRLVQMRYYQDQVQTDIAAQLGVSQMQVSRMLDRLHTKLRHLIGPLDERRALSR